MQTKNLTIRKFCTEDFDDFAELIRDKMASEYAIYDYPFPTDDESLKKSLITLQVQMSSMQWS